MRIAVLESNSAGNAWYILKEAISLGHDVVFFTEDDKKYSSIQKNPCELTEAVIIDNAYDAVGIADKCKKLHVDCLIAPGDYQLEVAAKVNHLLHNSGLHSYGPSIEAIANCKNKHLTRQMLKKQPNPVDSKVIKSVDDLTDWHTFPAIIKPLNGSGSVNVLKVNSKDEVKDYLHLYTNKAKNDYGFEFAEGLLIEAFLEGQEYSAEVAWNENHWELIDIVKKITVGDLFKNDNNTEIIHLLGGGLIKEPNLEHTLNAWLMGTGLKNGYAHVEFIVTKRGAQLVEINPRLPGGRIVELFSRYHDISLAELLVLSTLGASLPAIELSASSKIMGVCHIPIIKKGYVESYTISPQYIHEMNDVFVTKLPRHIESMDNDSRLLSFIMESDSEIGFKSKYLDIFDSINIEFGSNG